VTGTSLSSSIKASQKVSRSWEYKISLKFEVMSDFQLCQMNEKKTEKGGTHSCIQEWQERDLPKVD
jgi:hypothetical protein